MARKAAYHHGDLRRALLDAALAQIEDEGVAALSLREVARRAGVTHQAPYHHFADRAALLGALAAEGFSLLLRSMQTAQAAVKAGARARLVAAGKGYIDFALAHPGHFRLMFRPELHEGAQVPEGGAAYQVLVDSVEAAQAVGEVPAGPPGALVTLCWSVVHGFALLWLDSQLSAAASRKEAQAGTLAMLDALLAGAAPGVGSGAKRR